MQGYLRNDGRKGIRNVVVVAYLVECAHHVARKIVQGSGRDDVHLIGFPGCFPNEYAFSIMEKLCTHPNVGGALLVSLGCEGFNNADLLESIKASGRPASVVTIQESGGTAATLDEGGQVLREIREVADKTVQVEMGIDELVVGTICGGSDGTSGISANPAVGRAFDKLIEADATCLFEETGELIGCESVMSDRAETEQLGQAIRSAVDKAARYYSVLGYGSFAPGNADGGLTTIEEKSMGAYAKSGAATIRGLVKPGQQPDGKGLFLLDVVPDGEPRYGFPNISDNAEIVELISCGCHVILFTTGRGSVVGSAISPVIKVCANPDTYRRMSADMDVNAGTIVEGEQTIDEVGEIVFAEVLSVASGEQTKSEALGHQEFILTYKTFDDIGPSCHPHGRDVPSNVSLLAKH
ncbi:MAG: UxaA family hydrolase [Gammaproteobacteria bacterium]|nr:UxaA family hydrolase [Gammaproteobacteria bacterium]